MVTTEELKADIGATPPVAKVAAPAFRIETPETTANYIKALVYGPYGAGKTTFASSAVDVPEMGRVLFVDAESGSMSLGGLDLDVVRINKYNQIARIYEFLRLHVRYRDANNDEELSKLQTRFRGELKPGEKPYRYNTVVVDSLTEVQKYCMYALLGVDFSSGSMRLDQVNETPQFKEWGENAEQIRLLIRSFRDLPMHVIFVCSEQEKDDEAKVLRRPNLPGKLAGEIQGFFDVVGYLRSLTTDEGVMRRLYLRAGNNFVAKHRFRGVDAAYLDNPTLASLLDLRKQAKQ